MTDDAEIGRDHPLNAQQMAALQQKFKNDLQARINDIELRKLAVFEAVRYMGSPAAGIQPYENVMKLAKAVYEFISQPVAEVKITTS